MNNRFLPLVTRRWNQQEDNTPSPEIASNQGGKSSKPPPIYTKGTSFVFIIDLANALGIPKSKFNIKEAYKESHTIFTNTLDHHRCLVATLIEVSIQFYTFTPKSQKPKSILIKGIKGNFYLDDIKKEITDLRIPNLEVLNITKFTFNKSIPDKFHHLVQLSAESKPSELFKVKTLAYQRVKWEKILM